MKRLSFPNENLADEGRFMAPFMEPTSVTHNYSYLNTATKFGPVVKGFRKPGHHIPGPARNPHCPCDHCRHFFDTQNNVKPETGNGRTRAFSLGHAAEHSSKSSSSYQKNNFNSSSYDSLNII